MKVLVLGKGKTGALVAECARERGHQVTSAGREANITPQALAPFDVVIDFTTPQAAIANIEACAHARKKIVVGTTGWYAELPRMTQLVLASGASLLWGGNFSIGVNLFYSIVRSAASAASQYGYDFSITETHHIHKKDAPSGTALALQQLLASAGIAATIESVREGENMGRHQITLTSPVDAITLTHQAHSRRGFALGAVRAAEWLASPARQPGIYDFSAIFQQLDTPVIPNPLQG